MLTLDQLRSKVPAAFAERPASHVSENYSFIPTYKVLEELAKKDWVPIFGKQQRTRNLETKDSTKHLILLRNKNVQASHPVLGSLLPTIRLINSHDWSTIFKLVYGQLRLACGNGLTYEGDMFGDYSLRHDSILTDLAHILSQFEGRALKMEETALRWAEIPINLDEEREFAYKSAKIRYGDNPTEDHISSLLVCRRDQDATKDLFHVYNKIQENALKGGNKIGKRKSRAITNIGKESEVNKGIFLIASSYDKDMNG